MANPTADWEKVGDRFYRKIQLYTAVFDQDLELDNYLVTGAPYGGAIGMLVRSLYVNNLPWYCRYDPVVIGFGYYFFLVHMNLSRHKYFSPVSRWISALEFNLM